MGKLAERLSDARRSGIYRVVSTEALEEAVALNGFALARAAPAAFGGFLAALQAAASGRREEGLRFFAAFLDPAGTLSLAPLYHWQRVRSGL